MSASTPATTPWQAPTALGDPHTFASIWYLPGLVGSSAWGPHDAAEIDLFFEHLDWVLDHLSYPFDFFVDYARVGLRDHDWRSFARVASGARQRMPRLGQAVRRWVCVAPSHVVGMAIAGSQRLLGAPYPTKACRSWDEALRWLGRSDAPEIDAWLRDLPRSFRTATSGLTRLRALLAERPELSLEAASGALAVAPRSLQRMLGREQTTFRAEQARARAALVPGEGEA
ncbi:MAG: hypothetical protein U1F43_16690 [Myxococcota bacterium]